MRFLRHAVIVLAAITLVTGLSLRCLRAAGTEPSSVGGGSSRIPVLIELFTSEGCSSCPPADALLEKLDRSQPVRSAELVVLSEHVDYWNDVGWKDPYSSRQFSLRQSDYAHRFRLNGPYTPQMVVDGDFELVGSDERRAIHVIENAIKTAKLPIALSSIHREDSNTLALHVKTEPPASWTGRSPAQVFIALADDSDSSSVRGGENSGRVLKHVAVVRNMALVGATDNAGTFSKEVAVSIENTNQRKLRIIAIVQEAGAGRVLGVGSATLPN